VHSGVAHDLDAVIDTARGTWPSGQADDALQIAVLMQHSPVKQRFDLHVIAEGAVSGTGK
jgi:hypothetical protein